MWGWFGKLFSTPMKNVLRELAEEAERQHVEHEVAARHHAALAQMYEQRVKWAQERIAQQGEAR